MQARTEPDAPPITDLKERVEAAPVVVRGDGRRVALLIVMAVVLVVMAVVTVAIGTYELSVPEVWRVMAAHLFGGDVAALDKLHNTVVWDIRAPRVLLVILVGAALATSGAVYQGAFRNPLVEPFILGVSAGASLGAALAMVFPNVFFSAQLGAFVFALAAVGLAYFLARVDGKTPTVTLVLAGLVISSLFQAIVSLLKYLSDDQALRAITFWTMGGFSFATWSAVGQLALPIIIGVLVMWALGWRLNVLSMGDDEARTLGINPELLKLVLIVAATLITAIAVSATGIIAWIGLMMPHAVRMMLGPDNRFVIPASALLAGMFLLVCDTLARTITNAEIPISIITSTLGAPYIFYLLRSKGRLGIGA